MLPQNPVPLPLDQLSQPVPLVDHTLLRAGAAGVDIRYLGTQPYAEAVTIYAAPDRNWILAPIALDPLVADAGGSLVIPRQNLARLKALVANGIDFPAVFVARDFPRDAWPVEAGPRTDLVVAKPHRGFEIPLEVARRLVPSIPQPRIALERSRRYGEACDVMLKALKVLATGSLTVAAAVAAAPLVVAPLVGGAFDADPILFGALPLADELEVGKPAAWFFLTAWDY